MKSTNLVETCEVLCSNSFRIEFVWWIADTEEENCDGFIMVLVVENRYYLTENTLKRFWL